MLMAAGWGSDAPYGDSVFVVSEMKAAGGAAYKGVKRGGGAGKRFS
jgi:hypothetical protein